MKEIIHETIQNTLNTVSVIDPHCHFKPEKISANNLDDILLYHHVWVELVSSGMHIQEVTKTGLPHELTDPEMEPYRRVIKAIPHLHKISNTTSGVLLRWLLEDLYDYKENLCSNTIDNLFNLVKARGKDASWQKNLYKNTCRLTNSITVEEGVPYSETIHFGDEKLKKLNLIDGKHSSLEILKSMEKVLNREIHRSVDYVDYTHLLLDSIPIDKLTLIAFWVVPSLNDLLISDRQIDAIITKTRKGESLSSDEIGSFSYYGFTKVLEILIKKKNI